MLFGPHDSMMALDLDPLGHTALHEQNMPQVHKGRGTRISLQQRLLQGLCNAGRPSNYLQRHAAAVWKWLPILAFRSASRSCMGCTTGPRDSGKGVIFLQIWIDCAMFGTFPTSKGLHFGLTTNHCKGTCHTFWQEPSMCNVSNYAKLGRYLILGRGIGDQGHWGFETVLN